MISGISADARRPIGCSCSDDRGRSAEQFVFSIALVLHMAGLVPQGAAQD